MTEPTPEPGYSGRERSRGAESSWRETYVVDQRARRRSFRDIGQDLGVSYQRAQQLWAAWHKREQARQDEVRIAAENARRWQEQVDAWRAWRRRTDELYRVVVWMRWAGGAEAFAKWSG